MENKQITKELIKQKFYEERLEFQFDNLWKLKIQNGTQLTIEQIRENFLQLPETYFSALTEILTETNYF